MLCRVLGVLFCVWALVAVAVQHGGDAVHESIRESVIEDLLDQDYVEYVDGDASDPGIIAAEEVERQDGSDPDEDIQQSNFKHSGSMLFYSRLDYSSQEVEVSVNLISKYKDFDIMLLSCWKSSKDDNDSRALVKITERDSQVFYGWLFSDSPSISTMEHPRYSVKLLRCYDNKW